MVRAIRAFLEFCYIVRKNIVNTDDLEQLQEALDRFHKYRQVFIDVGVRADFNLPRQHSLIHFFRLIRAFGAPNGLCSSITESKHIKAVKEPWRRSSRFKATIQMLTTNTRLDKLAAMRANFVRRGMLTPTPAPKSQVHNIADDDDDDAVPGPRTMASVQLAKVPSGRPILQILTTTKYLLSLIQPSRYLSVYLLNSLLNRTSKYSSGNSYKSNCIHPLLTILSLPRLSHFSRGVSPPIPQHRPYSMLLATYVAPVACVGSEFGSFLAGTKGLPDTTPYLSKQTPTLKECLGLTSHVSACFSHSPSEAMCTLVPSFIGYDVSAKPLTKIPACGWLNASSTTTVSPSPQFYTWIPSFVPLISLVSTELRKYIGLFYLSTHLIFSVLTM